MARTGTRPKEEKETMSTGLRSMTGFSRVEGHFEDASWVWEVRAVNGKNLDTRLRLPTGFESLDGVIRKKITQRLTRGNLQINLVLAADEKDVGVNINQALLAKLIDKAIEIADKKNLKPPRVESFFAVKGVVVEEQISAADPVLKKRNTAILKSLDELITGLIEARQLEGATLSILLSECMEKVEMCTNNARSCDGARMERIKDNFEQKFQELLGENLPQERLAQEAAALAVKADIREELDRLDAHVEQAYSLLKTGSPIGRKLDFLCQEFIREINTMCSKSSDIELTQIGLEMKSLIEQFREQAANVE